MSTDSPPVVVFSPDLMMRQKLVGELTAIGVAARGAATPTRLAGALDDGAAALMIELDGVGVDGPALVTQVTGSHPTLPVLGFCAHTRTELIDAATAAGARVVVSRGELTRRLAPVLDQLLGRDAT